jgi:Fur family ferric uptake transcriptional regulator
MKKETIKEVVMNHFSDYLKERSLRKTPERFAILEKIYSSHKHFDAESLFEQMQENYRVSKATVYNTIELLLNCHLIIKHPFGNGTALYEKSYKRNIHYHVVCTCCNAISEYMNESIQNKILSVNPGGYILSNYALYMYGVCPKCAKNQTEKMQELFDESLLIK